MSKNTGNCGKSAWEGGTSLQATDESSLMANADDSIVEVSDQQDVLGVVHVCGKGDKDAKEAAVELAWATNRCVMGRARAAQGSLVAKCAWKARN